MDPSQKLKSWTVYANSSNTYLINSITTVASYFGILKWSSPAEKIRVYFYVSEPGTARVSVFGKFFGENILRIDHGFADKDLVVSREGQVGTEDKLKDYDVGTYALEKGFNYLDLSLKFQSAPLFLGEVEHITLSTFDDVKEDFIISNTSNAMQWEKLPPIGELYTPVKAGTKCVFSEICVPKGSDTRGGSFVGVNTNGVRFGLENNNDGKKSVSLTIFGQETANKKIRVHNTGKNVFASKLGLNSQTYEFDYDWDVDTRYQFYWQQLAFGEDLTVYQAWFTYEGGEWFMVASITIPEYKPINYLSTVLESSSPQNGYIKTRCYFTNLWVRDRSGWHEVNTLTAKETNAYPKRKDFRAGSDRGRLFLEIGGMFEDGRDEFDVSRAINITHVPTDVSLPEKKVEDKTPVCVIPEASGSTIQKEEHTVKQTSTVSTDQQNTSKDGSITQKEEGEVSTNSQEEEAGSSKKESSSKQKKKEEAGTAQETASRGNMKFGIKGDHFMDMSNV